MIHVLSAATAIAAAVAPVASGVPAQVAPDGTVITAGPTSFPLSSYMSAEAQAQARARLTGARPPLAPGDPIAALRASSRAAYADQIRTWRSIYPVDIVPAVIGGVQTDVVTPRDGVTSGNARRVLINLHGGGFVNGSREGGQAESVPMAGIGAVKVVAVDYRMAPEHLYPAASEDVEVVYRELLKTYESRNIGIYGCSAGGALAGQAVARIARAGLPKPGAVGIFCSGLMPGYWYGGDSNAFAALASPGATPDRVAAMRSARGYFSQADASDPLVTPGSFPEVLSAFPPTLLVTGTRDVALSNALVTHARLQQAGVAAELLVQEGMGHGDFVALAGTPEAKAAHDVIWRFFDNRLGR